MRSGPGINQIELGNFVDDKLFGQNCFIFWTHTKNLAFAGEMNYGLKHNHGISYYPNGNLEFDGTYLYGNAHGLNCVAYHPNGSIKHTGEYKDGKFVGNSRNSAVHNGNFNININQNNNFFMDKCGDCSVKHNAEEWLDMDPESFAPTVHAGEVRKKNTRPGSAM